jgi:hypothetical protein
VPERRDDPAIGRRQRRASTTPPEAGTVPCPNPMAGGVGDSEREISLTGRGRSNLFPVPAPPAIKVRAWVRLARFVTPAQFTPWRQNTAFARAPRPLLQARPERSLGASVHCAETFGKSAVSRVLTERRRRG